MHVNRRHAAVASAVAVAVCVALLGAQPAPATTSAPPDHVFAAKLVKRVTGENVKKHMDVLQQRADANGGTRAAGTPGYTASRNYVAKVLRKAGYRVTLDPIDFVEEWVENSPPTLDVASPTPKSYVPNQDFFTFQPSPPGDVTAEVQGVDLTLPPTPTPTSTSGCEASDFAGFVPGRIALIQRGTCAFAAKVRNAGFAGASGIIIFNEGQPGRTDAFPLDIGEWRADIPMVFAGFSVGNELAATPGAVVRLKVDSTLTLGTDHNVLAESRRGLAGNVVMVGAHLDSVPAGPGINDNGSGVAAILESAVQMRELPRAQQGPFRILGSRGDRAARLRPVRRRPVGRPAGPDQALSQLRHGGIAQLRLQAVRRRRLRRGRRALPGRRALRRSRPS